MFWVTAALFSASWFRYFFMWKSKWICHSCSSAVGRVGESLIKPEGNGSRRARVIAECASDIGSSCGATWVCYVPWIWSIRGNPRIKVLSHLTHDGGAFFQAYGHQRCAPRWHHCCTCCVASEPAVVGTAAVVSPAVQVLHFRES